MTLSDATGHGGAAVNGDTGPAQESDETHKERVDRELGELLQGMRVAGTGVQVLFAFLLTLPFSAGFEKVDHAGRWLFYIAMLSAAVASICFIAPATQHRVLFRSSLKEPMLHRANRLGVVGGVALAISMTCSTGLVVESFLGSLPAALLAGGVAALSAWLWFVQPLLSLHRDGGVGDRRAGDDGGRAGTP
ncbi:hypothetical protein Sme01_68770 [Sphaerisporangium melleum]|uniref:Uncharacterized protein n=1 Tax=Sphaerisporangium melleum TaxID=321316 RepID=A0A917RKF9_9ACTN|nr:DUF6328 family protein [Sphaerisporangium melleum]GGL12201.1 hypothetical protein GCM10007964_62800 [Sphaerisporangium melleum]GII74401.1 hypothetical protein Sme01_68770 [Sphaerisporangium melleum]